MTARLALLVAVACAACLETRTYRCESDADCTGSGLGRCEDGGVCSFDDETCDSGRRFGVYSGDLANQCTVKPPTRALRNACVAGELSPTEDEACAEDVCEQLPACCNSIWSEACVRLADQLCGDTARCGRWIAAVLDNEILLLRREPSGAYMERASIPTSGVEHVAWLDARASDHRPLLATSAGGVLELWSVTGDELALTVTSIASHTFPDPITDITAVDVDDDGTTLELGLGFSTGPGVRVVNESFTELATIPMVGSVREIAWADHTRSGGPDLALATDAGYYLYSQSPDGDFVRVFVAFDTMPSTNVAWADLDGAGVLDLVVQIPGANLVHLAVDTIVSQQTTTNDRETGFEISTGDLDGDLHADIALVRPDSAGMPMMPQTLHVLAGYVAPAGFPPTYKLHADPASVMDGLRDPLLVDVDDDGDLDLVGIKLQGTVNQGLVWLPNKRTSPPSFDPPQLIPAAVRPKLFAVTGW